MKRQSVKNPLILYRLMQKRGLSSVVTTVLVIAVSITLVALLGILVVNELSSTPDAKSVISGISIRLNLPLESIFVNQTSRDVTFMLERRAGRGEMDGFAVILDNDQGTGKTYMNFENNSMSELERRTFAFRHDMQGLITYLKIVPIIQTSEGVQLIASAAIGYAIGPNGYAIGNQDITLEIQNSTNNPSEYDPLEIEGLISYLSFDTESWNGNRVLDIIDDSRYVTLQGPVQQSSGISNQGIVFDGQNANVTFNTNQLGNFGTEDFTLLAWVNAGKYNEVQMIVSKGNIRPLGYTPIYSSAGLAIDDGVFYSSFSTDNERSELARGAVREGVWHQVVMTRRGNEHKFYIDGQLRREEQTPQQLSIDTNANISIGSRYCPGCFLVRGDYFNGTIDEVMIFNRSLTNQEIEDNYESLAQGNSNQLTCTPSDVTFLWTTYSHISLISPSWKDQYVQPFYPDIEHKTTMSHFIVVPGNSYDNHYPHISATGQFVYGGIPQNADLNLLRQHIREYTNISLSNQWYAVPPDFDGYIYLDYELWPFVWSALDTPNPNDGISPYVTASKDKVRAQHPSWTEQQIEAQAEIEWNQASEIFITTGINELRQLFPNAKIGLYGYPYAPIFDGYTSRFGDKWKSENDQMGWLWSQLDYISPSVYVTDGGVGNENNREVYHRQFIYNAIKETRRIADQYNKPIIPFTNQVYYNITSFDDGSIGELSEEDLRMQYEIPIIFGSEGILLWGYENTQAGLDGLRDYLIDIMGPTVRDVRANSCPVDQVL